MVQSAAKFFGSKHGPWFVVIVSDTSSLAATLLNETRTTVPLVWSATFAVPELVVSLVSLSPIPGSVGTPQNVVCNRFDFGGGKVFIVSFYSISGVILPPTTTGFKQIILS